MFGFTIWFQYQPLWRSFDASLSIRLEAPVFAWNAPSMRVLEKCGFVREGVLRSSAIKDGHIIDRVMYALISEGGSRPPSEPHPEDRIA